MLLDAFTEQDLENWEHRFDQFQNYFDRAYFDLERQRAARYDDLCSALRAIPGVEVSVDHWQRVTDWRWSLTPLSPEGSLHGIGGRFNIGDELDRARGQAFPCLYLAEDPETAYQEYFGGPLASRKGKLTLGELALRREGSFTTFALKGQLGQAFDLRDRSGLEGFTRIIKDFEVAPNTRKAARSAGLQPRDLVRTSTQLLKALLTKPALWRQSPQMFGIPAPCQIFGRFIRDAGFEAIRYPSQQGG